MFVNIAWKTVCHILQLPHLPMRRNIAQPFNTAGFGFGIWVLVEAIIRFNSDTIPNSFTMSWVGGLALAVNALVALRQLE